MATIAEMQDRAQRQLDGMRVNHNVLARDVLSLIEMVQSLNEQLAQASTERFTIRPPRDAHSDQTGNLPPGFEELFARRDRASAS